MADIAPGTNPGDSHWYTASFSKLHAVEQCVGDLAGKLDKMRHFQEVALLRDMAQGDIFDCSIGVGRFVNELPNVTSYSGMDYSPQFLDYVRESYPGVECKHGDLLEGIDEPDSRYDTTFCTRTLFAFESADQIIREMLRITRPGGTVIFDYGIRVDKQEGLLSSVDIQSLLDSLPLAGWRRYPLDGLFALAKQNRVLWRVVDRSARLGVMERTWQVIERLSLHFYRHRYLYVLTRSSGK